MKSISSTLAVLFMRLCALFPLPVLHRIGSLIGWLVYRIPNKAVNVTRTNLSVCFPELSTLEREQLIEISLKETAKAGMEAGPVWLWPAEKARSYINDIHNVEILNQAMEANKGIIVLTPHLGNWEMVNLYLSNNFQVTGLYSPQKLPTFDKLVYNARARTGAVLVPASPRGLIKVRKALGTGGVTMILPDQEPHRNHGIYAPFFGHYALSMTLVSSMLKRTGSQIVCMYGKRLAKGKGYDIICREPDEEIYSDDLDVSVAALNRSMEFCIRDIPEQYNWEYKRFGKQPDGKKIY